MDDDPEKRPTAVMRDENSVKKKFTAAVTKLLSNYQKQREAESGWWGDYERYFCGIWFGLFKRQKLKAVKAVTLFVDGDKTCRQQLVSYQGCFK